MKLPDHRLPTKGAELPDLRWPAELVVYAREIDAASAPLRKIGARFEEIGPPLREASARIGGIGDPLRKLDLPFQEISASFREFGAGTGASMAVIVAALEAPRLAQVPPKRGRGRPPGTGRVVSNKALLAEWKRLVDADVKPYRAARLLTRSPGTASVRHLVRVGKGLP